MSILTPREAAAEVAGAFVRAWNDETAIAWPGVAFDPTRHKEFARFHWQPTIGEQASIGALEDGLTFRRFGLCFVQVFTEPNKGLARLQELEERALKFFETYRGHVTFRAAGIAYIGPDRAFEQSNVSAQFFYDSTRFS